MHPDTGISSKAMSIMNSFINDAFERIAVEAGKLVRYNKKGTLSSREIRPPCASSSQVSRQARRLRGHQGRHQVHVHARSETLWAPTLYIPGGTQHTLLCMLSYLYPIWVISGGRKGLVLTYCANKYV